MRILFLTASLEAGGAERQLSVLARGLHVRGHDVRVLTFYDRGRLKDELVAAGVSVQSLGKSGRWDLIGLLPRLISAIRAAQPDIVHSYLTVPNIAAALIRPLLGVRVLVWGIRYADLDLAAYDRITRLTYRWQPRLARCADLVIANSEAGRTMALREGYPAARLAVVANGIDTEYFRPDIADRAATRAGWGLAAHARAIGVAARFDPMKDHATFLRAAAALSATDDTLRFVCLGGGLDVQLQALRALAGELGIADRVFWTGPVADMAAAWRALDLCVLSSAYGEGFPNVVAEAMASGLRCAVTDVGDAATIVGETGRVVPPRDPAALAAACRALLDTTDGADPRTRIVENFGVSQLIAQSEALLTRTLARMPGRTACAA